MKTLRKKFKSPKEAEEYYFPQKVAVPELLATVTDSEMSVGEICVAPGLLSLMSNHDQQLNLISELFKSYCVVQSDISPLMIS